MQVKAFCENLEENGEAEIRTLEAPCDAHTPSKRALSTTQTPLQIKNCGMLHEPSRVVNMPFHAPLNQRRPSCFRMTISFSRDASVPHGSTRPFPDLHLCAPDRAIHRDG